MGAGRCQHQALLLPSHRSEPKCHLLLHPTRLILRAPGSPAGAGAAPNHPPLPLLPRFQHSRHPGNLHSPGPCCGRWGGVWGHLVGDTPRWGCSVLSHPLVFPQGIGWWHPLAVVPEGSGRWFPGKSPGTGSPPPQRGRRWLRRWHGTLGSCWVPSWESHPWGPILRAPSWIFHPEAIWQKFSGRDRTHLDGFPLVFGHLIPAPCPISAQMSHPGCPILGASSWISHPGSSILEPSGRGLQGSTGHTLITFLWLWGTSFQLPALFLPSWLSYS